MYRYLISLLIISLLSGCGSLDVSGSRSVGAPGTEPPPAPRWDPAGGSDATPAQAPDTRSYSREIEVLRGEVLARCGTARVVGEQALLPRLVDELYLSGIAPGDAVDALILGDCGPTTELVSELIAQGGAAVAVDVAERARMLIGPGSEGMIEAAVDEGLERHALARAAAADGSAASGFAMTYYASRAPTPAVETADTATALYTRAKTGYGLYTFVVSGSGAGQPENLAELLRVIDTYVLAPGGTDLGSAETHAFLVAVDSGRDGRPLEERAGAAAQAVSAPMRRDLGLYLTRVGEGPLARRLVERPGPFLVSGAQASLVPVDGPSPRLFVDLSEVGGEYMYAVVDAFDRPVPASRDGGSLALDAVRTRLLSLVRAAAAGVGPKETWVFRVEGVRAGRTGPDADPDARGRGGEGPAAPGPIIEYQRPKIREAGLAHGLPGRA